MLWYVLALANFYKRCAYPNWHEWYPTALRDAVLLKINNLLSRVTIGNEFSSLMFATTGGFAQFDKLLVERLFDLLFGDI